MANEPRRYQIVLNEMLKLIESGEFPPGGRLPPERVLAERFSVSRPTIREAIIALEALGHVEVKTGSGIYVLERAAANGGGFEHISPFELTETRALVEAEAAALAASLITKEELAELEQSLHDMANEHESGDLADGDADRRFHEIISRATRNNMLVAVIDQLWHVRNHVPRVFRAYKSICDIDGAVRVAEHQQIYEALVARDAAAARSAMHEHFAQILDKLIATSEAEQIEKAREQARTVRERFSLDHLVSSS